MSNQLNSVHQEHKQLKMLKEAEMIAAWTLQVKLNNKVNSQTTKEELLY
jgi:hypothetical protein